MLIVATFFTTMSMDGFRRCGFLRIFTYFVVLFWGAGHISLFEAIAVDFE